MCVLIFIFPCFSLFSLSLSYNLPLPSPCMHLAIWNLVVLGCFCFVIVCLVTLFSMNKVGSPPPHPLDICFCSITVNLSSFCSFLQLHVLHANRNTFWRMWSLLVYTAWGETTWLANSMYIQNISIACIRAHCIRYFRTSKLHNIEHNESICKLVKGTQLVVSFQCDTYVTYSVHGPYI